MIKKNTFQNYTNLGLRGGGIIKSQFFSKIRKSLLLSLGWEGGKKIMDFSTFWNPFFHGPPKEYCDHTCLVMTFFRNSKPT